MGRFQPATRKQLKLRMAICGPTGAGKTRTALKVAKYLGKRVAVIDTENRSASIYVGLPDVPDFDVLELDSFTPRSYYEAIRDAEREGYDVIIVDSGTHAWNGKDGVLAMVDNAAKRSQAGNSYTAWRDVTPEHNELVEAFVRCKAHLIVTMRSKMEYVLEEDSRGKKVPRKVGMAPIQREGMEYEFSVVAEMDVDHNLMVSKTRLDPLDGYVKNRPGREFAELMLKCLNEGIADNRPLQREGFDEYGLQIPTVPCPVVRAEGVNKGKRWDELPGGLVQKMHDNDIDRMNEVQRQWVVYLVKKRAARKAAEAEVAAKAEADAADRALAAKEQTRPFEEGPSSSQPAAPSQHTPSASSPTSLASSGSTTALGTTSSTATTIRDYEGSESAPDNEGGCGACGADASGGVL